MTSMISTFSYDCIEMIYNELFDEHDDEQDDQYEFAMAVSDDFIDINEICSNYYVKLLKETESNIEEAEQEYNEYKEDFENETEEEEEWDFNHPFEREEVIEYYNTMREIIETMREDLEDAKGLKVECELRIKQLNMRNNNKN